VAAVAAMCGSGRRARANLRNDRRKRLAGQLRPLVAVFDDTHGNGQALAREDADDDTVTLVQTKGVDLVAKAGRPAGSQREIRLHVARWI